MVAIRSALTPCGTKPVARAVCGSRNQAPPSEPIGLRDIDSTPPARIRCSPPPRTRAAAVLPSSRPEPQKRLSCTPAAVSGRPASSAAARGRSPPCSPIGGTMPSTRSSIAAGSSPGLRSRSASIRPVTSEIGLTPCSAPLSLPRPRGGRTASYTKASEDPGDQLLHDLVRAAVDLLHPGVRIHPGDRVLGGVAVAAEDLQALVHHLALSVGEPQLGHGRRRHVQLTTAVPGDAVVEEDPRGAGAGG